jgi:hypothetical protein
MSAIGAFTGVVARGVSCSPSSSRRVQRASGSAVVGRASGLGSRRSQGVVGAGGAITATAAAAVRTRKVADRRGLFVVARAAGTGAPEGGDTRLGSGLSRISADVRNQIKKNFTMLPVALICLLVGKVAATLVTWTIPAVINRCSSPYALLGLPPLPGGASSVTLDTY